ncbi:unnamed protein product [Paramecium sonneborni]|uniref:Uncharacterized protein n=1 Tax=Paramecium sonneborni TaxID=65129 RepID=A0A8S1NAL8_9CILI|nr:unnamed protein product [Paramecium sonneborni]
MRKHSREQKSLKYQRYLKNNSKLRKILKPFLLRLLHYYQLHNQKQEKVREIEKMMNRYQLNCLKY